MDGHHHQKSIPSSMGSEAGLEKDQTFLAGKDVESASRDGLSVEHREFLIARHGTADLEPLPTMDPADPLNWPQWKKNFNLVLMSFHAMMTTFGAAAVIPAFFNFHLDFNISLTQASYLTSVQIVILGFAPLFWKPLSNRYGRRPIWLISTLGSLICNIGCAYSNSYAAQIVTRILVAFFISPAGAIGSAVVAETFFKRERGQKMGVWTLLVVLGPPMGPFIMGFVAYHTGGWFWIYIILAIVNAVQFLLYFFFCPETLYNRDAVAETHISPFQRKYFNFRAIGAKPLSIVDFVSPLKLFAYPLAIIPCVAFTVIFGFASVLVTVEIPQIFTPKWHFNDQQIGLQFLGLIIGSVLGEQVGGRGSDYWMRRGRSKGHGPEWRLWLAYPGIILAIVGLVVFAVQTDVLSPNGYNITPVVGIAIAGCGNQIVTNVLITYAVDCLPIHAASIGVFYNLIRSTWGFIGPFWFPTMIENAGLRGSAGIMAGLLIVFSFLPTLFVQVFGSNLRQRSVAKHPDIELNAVR